MKRFYLLSLLTATIAVQATAQHNFEAFYDTGMQKSNKELHNNKQYYANISLQNTQEESPFMMPAQEEEWLYEEGEWVKYGDYYYTYDNRGNKIRNIYKDGGYYLATDISYNENNLFDYQIESESNDGVNYENVSKRVIEYDYFVTNTIIDSRSYQWNNDNWALQSDGHTYKRVITRNEKKLITSVEIYTYFMDEYHLQMRSTITYNGDGLAEEWKYEELGYNKDKELVMQEVHNLKDMQWYTTDGQILVLDDVTAFFAPGHNRLKKATAYQGDTKLYKIEATYKENGDYNYSILYENPMAELVFTHTLTGSNGSYTNNTVAREDINNDGRYSGKDEIKIMQELNVTYDQYGRIINETLTSFDEIMFASKYEYTYSNEYGSYPTEQVFYDYDFDSEKYVPFLKIIGKDFIDIVAVNNPTTDRHNAPDAIYNINGMRLNTTTEELPAGIYIIRKDGVTSKVAITR